MPKVKTLTKYKDELDEVFSKYIRLTHSDRDGMSECYTCRDKAHYKKLQCGHFISRNSLKTRWSVDNCRPQCWGCNGYGRGKPLDFEERLKLELGNDYIEEMKMTRHEVVKNTPSWYEEQIKYYKELVKGLTENLY